MTAGRAVRPGEGLKEGRIILYACGDKQPVPSTATPQTRHKKLRGRSQYIYVCICNINHVESKTEQDQIIRLQGGKGREIRERNWNLVAVQSNQSGEKVGINDMGKQNDRNGRARYRCV